jgi:hypothetical protein
MDRLAIGRFVLRAEVRDGDDCFEITRAATAFDRGLSRLASRLPEVRDAEEGEVRRLGLGLDHDLSWLRATYTHCLVPTSP